MIQPTHGEVVAGIRSLFDDEVQPLGRILRKRCGERAAARCADSGAEPPDVDPMYLQQLCEESAEIHVESEPGGEWTALLEGHVTTFVDFYDPVDPYPSELWMQAAEYFESLDGEDMAMPGGRYACAQLLLRRDLPFLSNRSLGQVCHIIQLAISQRKILGYRDGDTVPYRFSQSRAKEDCAAQQQPLGVNSGVTIATWEVLRQCLREILESTPGPRPGCVTVSNVKRLFRLRYQVELSQTALGYAKVTDLCQDHRLRDICSLRLQGRGYAVVQVMDVMNDKTFDKGCSADLCQVSCNAKGKVEEQSQAGEFPQPCLTETEVFGFNESVSLERARFMVKGTFIHFPQPAHAVTGAMQRSLSSPKNLHSSKDQFEAECHALTFLPQSIDTSDGTSRSRQCHVAIPDFLTTSDVVHARPFQFIESGERFLHSDATSSDNPTPKNALMVDHGYHPTTASQHRLATLRASGQATLDALAGEVAPPVNDYAYRTVDSWTGCLEQWHGEGDIACQHFFVADAHGGWISSNHIGQDVFMDFPGFDGGLHRDSWDRC